MIQVNLLPGGKKRASKGSSFSLTMPDFKSVPVDKWVLGGMGTSLVVLLVMGFLFMTTSGKAEDLAIEVESAAVDSARYAHLISKSQELQLRRDSIAERVAIIQEIDGARYIWPHLLDEVARALPEYTWLTSLSQLGSGPIPSFRIQGRAGNNFYLTRFMENLEASSFIRSVQLISTAATAESGPNAGNQLIYEFTLEASYAAPPSEILQTVPLFGSSLGLQ